MSNSLWPRGLYIPPGTSVHGILQARILEWVSMPFSKVSFRPRDRTERGRGSRSGICAAAAARPRGCPPCSPRPGAPQTSGSQLGPDSTSLCSLHLGQALQVYFAPWWLPQSLQGCSRLRSSKAHIYTLPFRHWGMDPNKKWSKYPNTWTSRVLTSVLAGITNGEGHV